MSIENAILELAAAIRYAADKDYSTTRLAVATGIADGQLTEARAPQNNKALSTIGLDNEMEAAVTQVETEAKAEKPSTAKAAIADALAKATKAKEAAAAPAPEETDPLLDDAPVELDYEKDVKPLLVKVGKDKTQLVALLEKFGAKKGDQIAKADYPAVVAAANKIIGG